MLLVLVLTMLQCTNRSTREGVGSLTTTQTQSYPIHIARDSLIFFKAFSSFFGCVALLLFGFCLFYYPLKFKIHHRHLRCQFNQLRSCSFVSICFADFFFATTCKLHVLQNSRRGSQSFSCERVKSGQLDNDPLSQLSSVTQSQTNESFS